jgi:hypothetical protein
MTPSKLRWGLLFIVVGVMVLLCNTGHLDWNFWYEILMWWPILLIAIGLEKIFQKTKLQFISYLSPLILVAAMIFVAIDTGSERNVKGFFSSTRWSEDVDPAVDHINAVINHQNIDLYITRTATDLISARFDRFSRKPDIDFSKSDRTARLDINRRRGGIGGAVITSGRRHNRDWKVSFSDDVPLSLKCIGDGADITLNLQAIPLQDLTIKNDDGDIDLRIGDKSPTVAILIDGADSDFRLKIPAGCGIEVFGDKYESYLTTIGFIKTGEIYHTEAFDSTAVKLKLEIPEELRHLSIEFD